MHKPGVGFSQFIAAVTLIIAAIAVIAYLSHSRVLRLPSEVIAPQPFTPDLTGELAPGALPAIVAALGPDGPSRLTHVIDPAPTPGMSGGTHLASEVIDGRPYGCAFDIAPADDPAQTQNDLRQLRLHGIAAWYRDAGSPDGAAGNGPHIHCVWPGAETSNPQNLQQVASFVDRYQGLAHRQDPITDWQDPSITPAEIAAVRHAYNTVKHRKPLTELKPYDAIHAHFE